MTINAFSSLLEEWQEHAAKQEGKVKREVSVYESDMVKVEALAAVYSMPVDEIMASILHKALVAVEEKMPYVPGPNVIRVEEGAEIYEDIGPMVKYLEAQKAIRD